MLNIQNNRSLEEIIIIVSSIVMTIILIPFSIYRYFNEQYSVALVEIICVMLMCAIATYVWKTKDVKYMTVIASVITLAALVGFNYMLGSTVLF